MRAISSELAKTLRNAAYASLTSRAVTDSARSTVGALASKLAQHEIKRGKRTHARVTKSAAHRKAVEAFLGDLLRAHANEKAQGWVYHATTPRSFKDQPVSHRMFMAIVQALEGCRFLKRVNGYKEVQDFFGSGRLSGVKNWATRFCATPKLLKFCEQHGVPVAEASEHFIADLPKAPLQVRERSVRQYGDKVRGRLMKWRKEFDHKLIREGEKLEADVKRINDFVDRFELRGGVHRGYIRIFNNGNDVNFKWNKGGRLYSQGDDSYQRMSKAQRLQMTFNGEAVCEIDIRASYLTIYHSYHGEQLDLTRDPYVLPELGEEARDAVKIWFVATFGSDKPITRWPKDIKADYLNETGKDLSKYRVRLIGDAAFDAFPKMRLWGTNGADHDWARLMWHESVIMFFTMRDLMEKGIPSLSVHDSLIVPVSKAKVAREQLESRFNWVTRMKPHLVVRSAA